jgi:hypothetical protein
MLGVNPTSFDAEQSQSFDPKHKPSALYLEKR